MIPRTVHTFILTVMSQVVPSDSEIFYKKYVSFSFSVGIPFNRSNQILDMITAISSELDSTRLHRTAYSNQ